MARNKKILRSVVIAVGIMAVGFLIYYLVFYNYEPTGPIGGVGVQGIVTDVSPSAKVITVFDSARDKEIYLALTDDTQLFDDDYRPVDLSYFKIGFVVEAVGEMTNENSLIPSEVYIRQETENPCVVCINGCDTCPEGCEECLIGIEKKLKDPNMKWYYSPEGSQKFNEITIPVFANDEPDTVINSLLQTLKDSSLDIKFLDPKKSSQWWISDDGWNINDPNAISIASPSPPGGGHRLSVNSLDPKTRELKYFISRIFLANDFTFNATNTSKPETANDFYDYVIAFQKGETRCTLKTDGDSGQYTIACSDRFQEAYDEQIPYLKVLDKWECIVSVKERIGDFIWLSAHGRRTGFLALVKDDGKEMKLIFTGQESPSCSLMIENQVPKEVYGACYDDAGNIEIELIPPVFLE